MLAVSAGGSAAAVLWGPRRRALSRAILERRKSASSPPRPLPPATRVPMPTAATAAARTASHGSCFCALLDSRFHNLTGQTPRLGKREGEKWALGMP